jgi:creatinine amidohydrolase
MAEPTTAPIRMSEMAGGVARDVYARNPLILLPMGSHEDQGPHAPMGDYLCADEVAVRIARRARDLGVETYVAPVVPFGGADYFAPMPGGIALEQATLKAVLADMFNCLMNHGLTRLIVINGHGGNVQALHDVTLDVRRRSGVLIPSMYLWKVGYGLLPGILGAENAAKAAGHGCDPLSSVFMHLFPDLVRHDLVPGPQTPVKVMGLDPFTFGSLRFEGAEIHAPIEYDTIAPLGVKGDPRLCSPETGAALVERLTEIGANFAKYYVENAK